MLVPLFLGGDAAVEQVNFNCHLIVDGVMAVGMLFYFQLEIQKYRSIKMVHTQGVEMKPLYSLCRERFCFFIDGVLAVETVRIPRILHLENTGNYCYKIQCIPLLSENLKQCSIII